MDGSAPPQAGRGLFERGLALTLVAALLATAFTILAPFGTILLWSLFMSVTIWPLHRWFLLRTGGHPSLAATLSVAVLLVLVVAPVVLATVALLPSLRAIVDVVSQPETWTLPAPPEWMRQIPRRGPPAPGNLAGDRERASWRRSADRGRRPPGWPSGA